MNNYGIYPQSQQSNPYYPARNSYPMQSNSIIWVQGIEGAKAYQVSPNSIVQLMDSENDGVFYIKVSDNIGMSSLRVFHYTEVEATQKENTQSLDLSEYVRKDELQQLIAGMMKQEDSHEQTISTAQSKSKSNR